MKKLWICVFVYILLYTHVSPVVANDDINALKESLKKEQEQLKKQQQDLELLENQLNKILHDGEIPEQDYEKSPYVDGQRDSIPGAGPRESLYLNLEDKTFEKSTPLFGSGWRYSFGGYAKLDFIHDFDGTGDEFQFITATIPVDGTPEAEFGSYYNLHARETRFNFEMRNLEEGLPFNKFFLEMDFYDETSFAPRLRHAFFQWGNLIAGRTWTTLTEMRSLPFLLDFAYGDALYGGRAAQLRWEKQTNDSFTWAAALEDWNDTAIANVNSLSGIARSNIPLLAVRGTYEWERAVITLGGSLAQLRWDGTEGISDSTALQWALVMGGRVYIDEHNKNYIGFGGSYGDGSAGNIISLAEGSVPGAILKSNGELETLSAWNSNLALHYEWSSSLSSNLSIAWSEVESSDFLPENSMKAGGASHINLIWNVSKEFLVGAEYMYGTRKDNNDAEGNAQRIQFSTMYSF